MSWYQKMLVLVFGVIVIVITGCSAWMDGITPAFIDPIAIEYSGEKSTIFTPYTSLWDLRRIDRGLDYSYFNNQKDIARSLEDDQIRYKYLKEAMQINMLSAEELKSTLFSPEGGVMSLLLAGSGIGIGALAISKPSDKRRIVELTNGK